MPSKPHLKKIDDIEPLRSGRLSTMPTASQVARQRALDKIGKDLTWFDAQVEASLNQHAEATCSECKLPEKKKLPSGQIKMLTIDTRNARLICDSCSNKQYKQQQKQNVMKRQDREGLPTLQEFWARNRDRLSGDEKAQFEERHDTLILFANEIGLCLEVEKAGIEFEENAFRAFTREFCNEVFQNGFTLTDIAAVKFFKPEMNDFYESWQKRTDAYGKATAHYMAYGLLSALPEHLVYRLMEVVERHLGLPVSNGADYLVRIQRTHDALEGNVWKQPDQ